MPSLTALWSRSSATTWIGRSIRPTLSLFCLTSICRYSYELFCDRLLFLASQPACFCSRPLRVISSSLLSASHILETIGSGSYMCSARRTACPSLQWNNKAFCDPNPSTLMISKLRKAQSRMGIANARVKIGRARARHGRRPRLHGCGQDTSSLRSVCWLRC